MEDSRVFLRTTSANDTLLRALDQQSLAPGTAVWWLSGSGVRVYECGRGSLLARGLRYI